MHWIVSTDAYSCHFVLKNNLFFIVIYTTINVFMQSEWYLKITLSILIQSEWQLKWHLKITLMYFNDVLKWISM